jgi:hypothetical protein
MSADCLHIAQHSELYRCPCNGNPAHRISVPVKFRTGFTVRMRKINWCGNLAFRSKTAHRRRKGFKAKGGCHDVPKSFILKLLHWQTPSGPCAFQFLWMLVGWVGQGFTRSSEAVHRAFLSAKPRCTLDFSEFAGFNVIGWGHPKKGTERVQTLFGICVSMVGPPGFEPGTKRL